jgi:hypothetical protein
VVLGGALGAPPWPFLGGVGGATARFIGGALGAPCRPFLGCIGLPILAGIGLPILAGIGPPFLGRIGPPFLGCIGLGGAPHRPRLGAPHWPCLGAPHKTAGVGAPPCLLFSGKFFNACICYPPIPHLALYSPNFYLHHLLIAALLL